MLEKQFAAAKKKTLQRQKAPASDCELQPVNLKSRSRGVCQRTFCWQSPRASTFAHACGRLPRKRADA